MKQVNLVDHPLVKHKLSLMRKKETPVPEFRRLMREVSLMLAYEASRDLPTFNKAIETPLAKSDEPFLKESPALVSILRAGNGLLDGFLELMPDSKVGYVGLYREEKAKKIVEYYLKLPENVKEGRVIVVDPMLATGSSADVALQKIKALGPSHVHFVCLLASKEGIKNLSEAHPDVPITVAAIDDILNDQAYIVPGVGDAGDRLFGTL